MKRTLSILAVWVLCIPAAPLARSASDLIVHEWGTFTSFQDDRGVTISGINVDDEPVPAFVHRLRDLPIFTPRSMPATWSQGAPRCHPDVTLRLETPVLYFYPQPEFPRERSFDVQASFNGGWLTEFYPSAAAENPGFPRALTVSTQALLSWRGLVLPARTDIEPPRTTERVWLAPRAVRAANVVNRERTEAEKYLFYRGVGRVEAPLRVQRDNGLLAIELRETARSLASVPRLWVVHVSPDGHVRFRSASAAKQTRTALPSHAAEEGASSGLEGLQRELKAALIDEGLYEDEAEAMLETWRLSYFESEGLRVFYLLPRAWTDQRLPLSISVPAETVRVMLGRIELISEHQRTMLRELYGFPDEAFRIPPLYYESRPAYARMIEGDVTHSELYRVAGRAVPAPLQRYESLGRFRDALLAHELRSATDGVMRKRLETIIRTFSACLPSQQGEGPHSSG
jgi:hypothetical protein